MCIFILLSVVFLIIMLNLLFIFEDYIDKNVISIINVLFGIISFICVVYIINKPTALDVYEGKTELEITYKKNIPVDSVVVYKKK